MNPRLSTVPMLLRLIFLALLALALAACSVGRVPPGPGDTGPALEADVFITADGTHLPLRSWLPATERPKAVILALHGFNDYSKAFEASGRWWCGQGIAVYAYDQRGFGASNHPGLWAGREVLAEDAVTAARLLRDRYPEVPLYLLGESMGGAVAVTVVAEGGAPPVDGIILSAPAVWSRSNMPFYQSWTLWLAARTIPWARFSGSGLGIQASDNIEMLRDLGRDPLIIKRTQVAAIEGLTNLMSAALEQGGAFDTPALVLYGQRDEVVPAAPTHAFWQSLPERQAGRQRVALYPEGWHMLLRDLQAETVWRDIAHWIETPDQPLPSGADSDASGDLVGLVQAGS